MNINKATDASLTSAITTLANDGLKINMAIPYSTLIALIMGFIISVAAAYAIRYSFLKLK